MRLKRAWSDATTHLLFEPVELLEKLAALCHHVEWEISRFIPCKLWGPLLPARSQGEIVAKPDQNQGWRDTSAVDRPAP